MLDKDENNPTLSNKNNSPLLNKQTTTVQIWSALLMETPKTVIRSH
jgi:hypothetical protein